ncbi:50S ribosomal protein L7/L12 [Mollicutes bacterium LVI A0039]|nr:50S ribosomal protein L7/L12 [Mollicutes bacterium LVI A0039]
MAFNKDQFIEDLKTMSVLELNDLVKAIEEEFGVSAAAPVAVAAAGEGVAEEAANKTVVLTDCGASKMAVIKAIRAANSELGLKEAKAIADNGGEVKADLPAEEAEALKAALEEAGATIELK